MSNKDREAPHLKVDEIPVLDLSLEILPDLEISSVDLGNDAELVEGGALLGMPEDEIARMVGLDIGSLRSRYPEALSRTPKRAREEIIASLRKKADNAKPSG